MSSQPDQQQEGENAAASNTRPPAAAISNPPVAQIMPDPVQRDSSRGSQRASMQFEDMGENWAEFSEAFEANVAQPSRKALHDFFYPSRQSLQNSVQQQTTEGSNSDDASTTNQQATRNASAPTSNGALSPSNPRQSPPSIDQNPDIIEQERQDKEFVEDFWTIYDDIIILSLFTQIGIIARLGVAYSFRVLDAVFRKESALFSNLPLNCFSCWVMGFLCSGESLMEIVSTRFTPPRLQQDLHHEARQLLEASMNEEDMEDQSTESLSASSPRFGGTQARRRKKTSRRASGWRPQSDNLYSELREVQLLALERRIRASPCLVLFHVKKEDADLVENYFNNDFSNKNEQRASQNGPGTEENNNTDDDERFSLDDHDLVLEETEEEAENRQTFAAGKDFSAASPTTNNAGGQDASGPTVSGRKRRVRIEARSYSQIRQADSAESATTPTNTEQTAQPSDLEQMVSNVATDVSQQISQLSRVTLADGWDVGTTPEDKKKDLMLGLRDGLCGALSSFSSWISSMVSLLRAGKIGEACVGIVIGIQLPIVAYRFGQHVAVCLFVWRCRRETKRDERRGGYGIRLSMDEEDDLQRPQELPTADSGDPDNPYAEENSETPSVRAVITALFVISVVAQVTSLSFYYEPADRLLALSLLFSPLGVLTRWRLSRYNSWRPNFPIGTFTCNILACALSGTLGSLLAGNPGPTERIALVALIAGFGGTLSSVARFIVEMLAGVDPILLRLDGAYYGMVSIFCGLLVSFVFTASGDWADNTNTKD